VCTISLNTHTRERERERERESEKDVIWRREKTQEGLGMEWNGWRSRRKRKRTWAVV